MVMKKAVLNSPATIVPPVSRVTLYTAVPPLFTQPCPGRTMSTAVCIYVAGLCANCPAGQGVTREFQDQEAFIQ